MDFEVIVFSIPCSRAGCPANLPLRSIPPTPDGAGPSRSRGHGRPRVCRGALPDSLKYPDKIIAIAHQLKNDFLVVTQKTKIIICHVQVKDSF